MRQCCRGFNLPDVQAALQTSQEELALHVPDGSHQGLLTVFLILCLFCFPCQRVFGCRLCSHILGPSSEPLIPVHTVAAVTVKVPNAALANRQDIAEQHRVVMCMNDDQGALQAGTEACFSQYAGPNNCCPICSPETHAKCRYTMHHKAVNKCRVQTDDVCVQTGCVALSLHPAHGAVLCHCQLYKAAVEEPADVNCRKPTF